MSTPEPRWPAAHVPALSRTLGDPHFPNGERAALKRMALDGAAPLALHRLLLRHVDEAWQGERWLPDWRLLVCALAIQRDGGFDPARPLGQALAEARYAESRLERLLSADGDTLRALVSHRYGVLKHYFKEVTLPVMRLEARKASRSTRARWRSARSR